MEVPPVPGSPIPPKKFSRALRKSAQQWEPLKEEVREFYFREDNTLEATMQRIKDRHGFQAR